MKTILENLFESFNNHNKGFSARKLTAFAIICCVIAMHIKWLVIGDLSQLEMILTIDYGFIATLFGMTTYSSIKTNKKEDETK